jgi:GH35 family endo-1,4-beta-xylanase
VNPQELLDSAPQRIREHRTAEVELRLVAPNGPPLRGAQARVQLARHAFWFGCNAFLLAGGAEAPLQEPYEARYSALLNYATLPVYWGSYERSPGVTGHVRLRQMADWCAERQIHAKGHPLVWHEVYPAWGEGYSDDEMLARLETRVHRLVSEFRGCVDVWDVVNEATVSHRFSNAVGRWIAREGALECVARALTWAREANPDATLLYNDFNLGPEFEALVAGLLDRGAPLDAIGIQSHMHKGTWPLERAWRVCESTARFGLPLHFTELTVLSGRLKAADDDDWHHRHTEWPSTREGERAQAEYATALYSLLYSHPAVEAITWWDLADHRGWQGAPAGLLRADMTPKPLYERLYERIHGEWRTDVQATADRDGQLRARCTFGHYRVEATSAEGVPLAGDFDLCREGPRTIEVKLQTA